MFKRILLAGAVVLPLTACPWYGGGTDMTAAQSIHALQLQLDATLEEMEIYADQPLCIGDVVVNCHQAGALIEMLVLANEADKSLDEARLAIETNKDATTVTFYASRARSLLARLATEMGKE